tara:strand:+ start:127 stop:372 length:246 start_codon:yes stop_codon:yes gene_type:complete
MKTKAQQLGITKFPYTERDEYGNKTYREYNDGDWCKSEFDENGNKTYREYSSGTWSKREYDENGDETYYENGYGFKEYTII